VDTQIEVSWMCRACDVGGQDAQAHLGALPDCWNCGGPVVVTARPTVRVASDPDSS
jgi:hypothetical protein